MLGALLKRALGSHCGALSRSGVLHSRAAMASPSAGAEKTAAAEHKGKKKGGAEPSGPLEVGVSSATTGSDPSSPPFLPA